MDVRAAAYYEARVALGLTGLLPPLGLPVFALLRWLLEGGEPGATPAYELMRAFEILLPLAAGLSAAHLMTVEHDEGFDELRRSYPEPAWRLPLQRTTGGLLLALLALFLGEASFRLAFGAHTVREVLLPALPPALYLLGLSLLASGLTQSYWATAALVMGYWFLEMQTRGRLTGPLYLFSRTWPQSGVSYALNRWLLVALGLLFLATNAWWYAQCGWRGSLGRRELGHG